MKTLPRKTAPKAAEQARRLAQLKQDAAALASVSTAAWAVLQRRALDAVNDATEASHEQDVTAESRGWLAGGAYHLREHWKVLADLHSGAWRHWPDMPQDTAEKAGGDEENEN